MRWMYIVNFMNVLSYRFTERYKCSVCFLFQKKKKGVLFGGNIVDYVDFDR